MGASSGLIAGSFMFSGVATTSPVLIRFFHLAAFKMVDHGLHGQVAHVHGVLQGDALDFVFGECLHDPLVGVEADKDNLAGHAGLFQRFERAGGVRFANGEQRIDFVTVLAQHLLGLVEGRLRRVAAVLIGRRESSDRDILTVP